MSISRGHKFKGKTADLQWATPTHLTNLHIKTRARGSIPGTWTSLMFSPKRPDLIWRPHYLEGIGKNWLERECDHSLHLVPRLRVSGGKFTFSVSLHYLQRDIIIIIIIIIIWVVQLCFRPFHKHNM